MKTRDKDLAFCLSLGLAEGPFQLLLFPWDQLRSALLSLRPIPFQLPLCPTCFPPASQLLTLSMLLNKPVSELTS